MAIILSTTLQIIYDVLLLFCSKSKYSELKLNSNCFVVGEWRGNNSTRCIAMQRGRVPGWYPAQSYLHWIKLVLSPNCPFCYAARETLTQLACICSQSAAHTEVRKTICSSLTKLISKQWTTHEETPMDKTGLRLELVSAACTGMEAPERQLPKHKTDMVSVDHLQPDLVMVS